LVCAVAAGMVAHGCPKHVEQLLEEK